MSGLPLGLSGDLRGDDGCQSGDPSWYLLTEHHPLLLASVTNTEGRAC